MVPDRVCKGSNSIVQNEQVLGLVFLEGCHEHLQDVTQVRHQLCTRLLLQGGKRTGGGEGVWSTRHTEACIL